MGLLSLGASFGALGWIFQDGHLSGLLGFTAIGSLDVSTPLLIFVFAFALSMDYEVFLLARIKETWDDTGDQSLAIGLGLNRAGRVVSAAALLMVVVCCGFATGQLLTIKQLSVGLAIAVALDATVVRCLLLPASMALLGNANWWAPSPLRRLHARYRLHGQLPGPRPVPGPPASDVVPSAPHPTPVDA
jgi:RND superfamily putative drug exporter